MVVGSGNPNVLWVFFNRWPREPSKRHHEKGAIHQDSQQQHQAVCRETWPWGPVEISARQRPKTHSKSSEEMVSRQKHYCFAVAQPESWLKSHWQSVEGAKGQGDGKKTLKLKELKLKLNGQKYQWRHAKSLSGIIATIWLL